MIKKRYFIFCLLFFPAFLQAQVATKTIDSYGVKFIVAEKVPDQLKFLMGSYIDASSNKTIQLKKMALHGTGAKHFL